MPDPLVPVTTPVSSAVEPADSGEPNAGERIVEPVEARAARAGKASGPAPGDSGNGDGDGLAIEGDDEGNGGDDKPSDTRRRVRTLIEWVAIIGGALLVAFLVRQTSAQAFYIPSESMEPTLHKGDRILVNKWSYRLHDVNRGDVVVFERPESAQGLDPENKIPDLIKRVIGLPGEVIEAREDGHIYIDGDRLVEPYLPADIRTEPFEPIPIPEGHVFVMGDNRANSSDSRAFGSIDEGLIVGRAFLRIYPLDDIGGL